MSWSDAPRYTLDYAPPEALESNYFATYSNAFDVWCLGATLYAMRMGHPPFRHGKEDCHVQNKVLRQRISNESFFTGSRRWAESSSAFKSLVAACLEKNRKNRITLAELQNHEWVQSITSTIIKKEINEIVELTAGTTHDMTCTEKLVDLEKQNISKNMTSRHPNIHTTPETKTHDGKTVKTPSAVINVKELMKIGAHEVDNEVDEEEFLDFCGFDENIFRPVEKPDFMECNDESDSGESDASNSTLLQTETQCVVIENTIIPDNTNDGADKDDDGDGSSIQTTIENTRVTAVIDTEKIKPKMVNQKGRKKVTGKTEIKRYSDLKQTNKIEYDALRGFTQRFIRLNLSRFKEIERKIKEYRRVQDLTANLARLSSPLMASELEHRQLNTETGSVDSDFETIRPKLTIQRKSVQNDLTDVRKHLKRRCTLLQPPRYTPAAIEMGLYPLNVKMFKNSTKPKPARNVQKVITSIAQPQPQPQPDRQHLKRRCTLITPNYREESDVELKRYSVGMQRKEALKSFNSKYKLINMNHNNNNTVKVQNADKNPNKDFEFAVPKRIRYTRPSTTVSALKESAASKSYACRRSSSSTSNKSTKSIIYQKEQQHEIKRPIQIQSSNIINESSLASLIHSMLPPSPLSLKSRSSTSTSTLLVSMELE